MTEKSCINCGRTDGAFSGVLCAACHQFKHRTGVDRPYRQDGRKEGGCASGESHYAWKGDTASRQTKRDRAVRRYALGNCERCGNPAADRHHKDDDTGNNDPSNIAILCRRCHMDVDGRLSAFRQTGIENFRKMMKPATACRICGRLAKPTRKGRCSACDVYFRRKGIEWTPDVRTTKGRSPKAIST